MAEGFDTFYFVSREEGNGLFVVKFGDSSSASRNATNYRSKISKYKVHGNAHEQSVGKCLENALLKQLVEKKYAVQIGATESCFSRYWKKSA